MKTLKVIPSKLTGKISIPPSKSHTMRALLFGAMGEGKSRIFNPLLSPDTYAMMNALRSFGIKIEETPECVEIIGCNALLPEFSGTIDCGNSGQVLRFVGALSCLQKGAVVFTGDHSIQHHRPITPLLEGVKGLGAKVSHSPLTLRGPIFPGMTSLSGEDSQPVSALLIATSFLNGPSVINVRSPGEKPWIDLTLSWLHKLGMRVKNHTYENYFTTGNLRYEGFDFKVPGDFSSLAFPLIGACITKSQITLENLDFSDVQGDKKIVSIVKEMGCQVEVIKNSLTTYPGGVFEGIEIDGNEVIDALPILTVMGCFAKSPLTITKAAIARKKESDRIGAICLELKKMGAKIDELNDGLVVYPSSLHGAKTFSHSDHRIAMSLAIAALGATSESTIEDIGCIEKSYPTFVEDFLNLGAFFS